MTCARCPTSGMKFYNVPSRKRGEFLEQVCKRCRDEDRKQAAKEKRQRQSAAPKPAKPVATQLGF